MTKSEQRKALAAAVRAARTAGKVMRQNLHAAKIVNLATPHDIKLELDVRCQQLIARILHRAFPQVALLGEEGGSGSAKAPARWVVDPIDGTVNYAYGIPHAAVSIALQERSAKCQVTGARSKKQLKHHASRITDYQTLIGVIYDPFQNELWTAIRGEPARCNGRVIHVSPRTRMREAIVAMGFAKTQANLRQFLPCFAQLSRRVRKVRIMGSAALSLTYVAMGRLDAYLERRINLWDFAAGALIIERAGGEFWCEPVAGHLKFRMLASNGRLNGQLGKPR
jgi:myo-inositol-1(or 4)-monophosphatase